MTDPNPYEPPQAPQPLKRVHVVKRGLGVAAILLLTPPAMVVAIMGSCAVARMAPGQPIWLAIGMPLAVLTGLMVGAVLLDRPRKGDPNQRPSRAGILLATPAVVVMAVGLGFLLALMIVQLTTVPGQGVSGLWTALVLFWLPPTVALLAMLLIAWRAGWNTR
jgi:hypothetical protein